MFAYIFEFNRTRYYTEATRSDPTHLTPISGDILRRRVGFQTRLSAAIKSLDVLLRLQCLPTFTTSASLSVSSHLGYYNISASYYRTPVVAMDKLCIALLSHWLNTKYKLSVLTSHRCKLAVHERVVRQGCWVRVIMQFCCS